MAEVASDELVIYAHSPVHYAVARHDYVALRRVISGLPRLSKAGDIRSEAESIAEEQRADAISSVIDNRDVPGRETALHLAVRLGDAIAVQILMAAGADWSLQNEKGWSALQEAVCAREEAIAMIIMRHYQPMAWAKWHRRLPRVIATLKRMRDFYMEFTFHFESSVIPFIGRIAPSDTYRVWKRGSNLRADMTLAGFDGFKIQRSDQSFLFLGEGSLDGKLAPGYLCILRHKDKLVMNALEGAGSQPSEAEISQEVASMFQTNLYRPGIDVTQAELMPQLTWRRHEKTETVGKWKAKVYDMHHVVVSVKSRRVPGAMSDEEFFSAAEVGRENGYLEEDYTELLTEEEKHELETALETDGAEMTEYCESGKLQHYNQNYITGKMEKEEELRLSSLSQLDSNGDTELIFSSKEEKKGWFTWSRRSFKQENGKKNLPPRSSLYTDEKVSDLLGESPNQNGRKGLRLERGRRSVGSRPSDFRAEDGFLKKEHDGRKHLHKEGSRKCRVTPSSDGSDESEYKKGLRPVLWLTETFPMETEELLPLLDVLANKVKAVRRLRELLTMKLPAGTFPVKVAIPVVPTIRVVVTFTRFEESSSHKEFNSTFSGEGIKDWGASQQSSSPWFSWRKWPASKSAGMQGHKQEQLEDYTDPFTIPSDYSWTSMDSKNWMGKDKPKDKLPKGKKGKPHTEQVK